MGQQFKCFILILDMNDDAIKRAYELCIEKVYGRIENIPQGTEMEIGEWNDMPEIEILGAGGDNRCAFCRYFRRIVGLDRTKRNNCPFASDPPLGPRKTEDPNTPQRAAKHTRMVEVMSIQLPESYHELVGTEDYGSFLGIVDVTLDTIRDPRFGISDEEITALLMREEDLRSKEKRLRILDDALKRLSRYAGTSGLSPKLFIQRQRHVTGEDITGQIDFLADRVDALQDSVEANEEFKDLI